MTRNILFLFVLGGFAGCAPRAATIVDLTGAYLSPEFKAAAPKSEPERYAWTFDKALCAEYAPGQHVALVWDETGLYCDLRGKATSLDDSVSISIRSKGDPGVTYIRLPILALQMGSQKEETGVLIRKLDPQRGSRILRAGPEEFKWLGFVPSQFSDVYGGGFWVSWKALGYDAPPKDEVDIVIRKIIREPPGAVFTLHRGGTEKPKSE